MMMLSGATFDVSYIASGGDKNRVPGTIAKARVLGTIQRNSI